MAVCARSLALNIRPPGRWMIFPFTSKRASWLVTSGQIVLAILSGTLIETTLGLLVACVAFWAGRSRRVNNLVMQINTMVQHYPVDIYSYTFRAVVTGLIPVAFMNYYPALMLLGKLDRLGTWWWLSYLSPLVALVMIG